MLEFQRERTDLHRLLHGFRVAFLVYATALMLVDRVGFELIEDGISALNSFQDCRN